MTSTGLGYAIKRSLDTKEFLLWGFVDQPKAMRNKRVRRSRTIKSLLSRLDRLFDTFSGKKFDKEHKQLLKSVGAFTDLSWGDDTQDWDVTDERVYSGLYSLPTFLAATWPGDDNNLDHIVFFEKRKDCSQIEPTSGGVLYEVREYFSCAEKKERLERFIKKHSGTNFFIEIKPSGEVRQLKFFETSQCYLPGRGKRKPAVAIKNKSWRLQPVFVSEKDGWEVNPDRARSTATLLFNMAMTREAGINVIATNKEGYKIVFIVPQHEWKNFFKERVDAKTETGRRIPIFHFVSAHKRIGKTKTSFIKTHMRGSRDFFWNDYRVQITLPGRHSAALASFNASPETYDENELVDKNLLTQKEVISLLGKAIAS